MLRARSGILSSAKLLGVGGYTPHNVYTHTYVGDANIQSNEADLDGVGDGIHFPHDAKFNFGANDFSIEAILNFDAFPQDYPVILGKWGASGSRSFQFLYRNDTNALRFAYTTDGTNVLGFDSSWTPTLGVKYHVAVVRKGSDLKLYVDGTQIGATHNISTDTIYASTARQTIGAYDDPNDTFASNGYLDGQIDFLKVADVAIDRFLVTPTGLYDDCSAVYVNSFNGANGSTPSDNTAGPNLFSHTWAGDADIQSNKAEFDGTGDYISITNRITELENLFIGSDDFTIQIKLTTDLNQTQGFFGIGNGGAGWGSSHTDGHLVTAIEYLGDFYLQWEVGGGLAQVLGAGSLTGGGTLTIVRKAGRISIYKDATRLGTTTTSTTIVKHATTGTPAATIGNIASLSPEMDGREDLIELSKVARYDAALASITLTTSFNDANTVYINDFTGANGTTPSDNTFPACL